MRIAEIDASAATKPLSPGQARIDALKVQKAAATERLQQERNRQKRQKAVQQLASLNSPANTV
jgi:hypothetical protein